ncbi:MAG: SMC-Scp complex subunit ScpB [Negativicutes bacterium]|nr:SMC-Scp complex subunit ScpB [Negativicutes bacterium]
MFYRHLKGHVEALLFAYGNPISAEKFADILEIDRENVVMLLEELKQDMADELRGLNICEVAGGYQLCSKPEMAPILERLVDIQETRLSMAAMETLAIIAFKQPVTRLEMENIRGVKVDGVVNTLLERGLIREVGRKEAIGRPILYGTTDEFLKSFGLNNLNELPKLTELVDTQEQLELPLPEPTEPTESAEPAEPTEPAEQP